MELYLKISFPIEKGRVKWYLKAALKAALKAGETVALMAFLMAGTTAVM